MKRHTVNITTLDTEQQIAYILTAPLPTTLIDAFHLALGRSDLAASLLSELLSGQLARELPPDLRNSKRLQEIYLEHRNRQRIYGGHGLYFGYPLLVFQQDSHTRIAPFWLWPIELTPPAGQDEGWRLSLSSKHNVLPNPELDDLLRQQFDWTKTAPWYGRKQPPTAVTLATVSHLINDVVHHLGIESPSQSVSIAPCPDRADLKQLAIDGSILWSGLLGLFPAGAVRSKQSAEAPQQRYTAATHHSFGLLERNPWQETALQLTRRNRRTFISGPAGSGKTSWLADFLINAMSNGQRCLVVSDRIASLQELQQVLTEAGVGDLLWAWLQSSEEEQLLYKKLQQIANQPAPKTFAAASFQQQVQQLAEQQDDLQRSYRAINKRIFGPYTWSQTVGLYLSAARIESKALLSSQLNAQDFDLTFEQYQHLREMVAHSRELYRRVGTLTHPLNALNVGIFLHQEADEARDFIKGHIDTFNERAADLQYRFILAQNDYADQLVEHYEQFYQRLDQQIRTTLEYIDRYRELYGQDPLQSKRATLKLYGYVSEKFRQTLAAKEDIAARYEAVEAELRRHPYLAHDFLPPGERHWLFKLRPNLANLQQRLYQWREQLDVAVQEDITRLNARTVDTNLPGHQTITLLEEQLDKWVDDLNESGLLQLPLENKNLTVTKRRRFLEEAIEKLEELRYNLRDFDRFYAWQRYWFGLPGEARRIIAALVKVKPDDWAAAFSSWFLHHRISRFADPILPEQLPELEPLVTDLRNWRTQLVDQILYLWAVRRQDAFRQLKKSDRLLFDQIMKAEPGRHPRLSGLLQDCFAVTLLTPAALVRLDPANTSFDWVVIDEAHTLPSDQWPALASWGDRLVMLSDPELSTEALLAWVRRQGIQQARLPVLSNTTQALPTIHMERLLGRYDSRQQINDEEARRLLSLLNLIEATPQRTLPSVAIVCLSRAQRNLVFQYLDRIKRRRLAGVEKVMQLERNGLGVYCPDELYGLHVDVLLLSVTFGPGSVTDPSVTDLEQVDHWYRPGLVPLLRSRARQQIHILHSVSEEDLLTIALEDRTTNMTELARWLRQLEQGEPQTPTTADSSTDLHPLADAIAWYIADRVRTERLSFNVPHGDGQLPICIEQNAGLPSLALLFNGYLAETPATNFEWEYQQQAQIQEAGYELLPIWAACWWRKPRREAQKLLDQLHLNAGIQEEE